MHETPRDLFLSCELFCTGLARALKGGALLSADEDQAAIFADHLLVQAIKRATKLSLPRSWIPNLLGLIAWGRRTQKPIFSLPY
jgi:hypothetical protein